MALATDCNPGSSFTSSMPFCIALAVREMGMTTEEAVWSATAGGARALRRTDIGHLDIGARADLILLDAPSHAYLAYRPGVPQVAAVWQSGHLAASSLAAAPQPPAPLPIRPGEGLVAPQAFAWWEMAPGGSWRLLEPGPAGGAALALD